MNIPLSLQSIGLTDKEAAAYNVLLQMKKGTALTVAQAADIKRPTAYLVLESLRKKKLVAVTKFRNVRDYRAMPLENLQHFVHEQKRTAERFLPAIQKMYNERKFKVRLRVYHGLSDVKTLLEKSLREKSAMRIFGDEERLESELGDYWFFYLKRSQQLSVPPQFKLYSGQVTLLLWSDKVAFIEFGEKIQVFGFKNKDLHDVYQKLYQRA